MTSRFFTLAFLAGLAAIAWVAWGFVAGHALALAVTVLIAAAYALGAWELRQFRAATAGLQGALGQLTAPPEAADRWLDTLPVSLRGAARLRLAGERAALPGPALTPYLIGLLVMLGMLGTFLGMVVTFRGTVLALQASGDLAAMRDALAEPIRGLGLSFGTSVAGVAASAMLGLMATLARRERADAARALDAAIAGPLAALSGARLRQDALRALHDQAQALPAVAQRLDALLDRLEQRSQALDQRLEQRTAALDERLDGRSQALDAALLARHSALQQSVQDATERLAADVGASLQQALEGGARAAGEVLQPAVQSALGHLADQAAALQHRLDAVARDQVDALASRFDALAHRMDTSARDAAAGWQAAGLVQAEAGAAQTRALREALDAAVQGFGARADALLAAVEARQTTAQAAQREAERERLAAWSAGLEHMAAQLRSAWQQAATATLAQQQAVCEAIAAGAQDISQRAGAQAHAALDGARELLERSAALVEARAQAEARAADEHSRRMAELTGLWQQERATLRADEQARGDAAVARLDALQAAVGQHLAQLGAALEAPLARLLETAAEVPRSAAGVIAELRAEMGRATERDTLALDERTALLARMDGLLTTLESVAGRQGTAVQQLVDSACATLEQAASRTREVLAVQGEAAEGLAVRLQASAVELGSLAEGFGEGLQQFAASQDRLLEGLQRVETALAQAGARSDEQLAYYVAQAREVIDLSLTAQQGLLAQLRAGQAAPAESATAA